MNTTLIQHGETFRFNQDAWRQHTQSIVETSTEDSNLGESTDLGSSGGLISYWTESFRRGLPLVIREVGEVLLGPIILAWLRHYHSDRPVDIQIPNIEQGAWITKVVHQGAFALVHDSRTVISPYIDLLLEANRLYQPSAGQSFRSAFQEKVGKRLVKDHGSREERLYNRRRELQKKRRLSQMDDIEAAELTLIENRIKAIQKVALDSNDGYLFYSKKTQELRSVVDALEFRILKILSNVDNQKNDNHSA